MYVIVDEEIYIKYGNLTIFLYGYVYDHEYNEMLYGYVNLPL
jgi:hypothetical protein